MTVRTDLRPGDKVMYCDKDQLRWGPWAVVGIAGDTATVDVEDTLRYSFPKRRLRRAMSSNRTA